MYCCLRVGLAICSIFESKIKTNLRQFKAGLKKIGIPKSLESQCLAALAIRTIITSTEINNSFTKIVSLVNSSGMKSFWLYPFKTKNLGQNPMDAVVSQANEYENSEDSRRFNLLLSLKNLIAVSGISLYKTSILGFINQVRQYLNSVTQSYYKFGWNIF